LPWIYDLVGGDQFSQQRFVITQAQHVEIEDQAEHAHGNPCDEYSHPIQARIGSKNTQLTKIFFLR
jgi:hypothetical protein